MEESIQIHRKIAGYTVIQNSLIRNTTKSLNSRILMIAMLSLPSDFKIAVKEICSITNGEDSNQLGNDEFGMQQEVEKEPREQETDNIKSEQLILNQQIHVWQGFL